MAAGQNHPQAICELASLYGSGEHGCRPDPVKACELFRQAALMEEPFAQYCLAGRLLIGRGIPKDSEEAYFWAYRALRHTGRNNPDPTFNHHIDELVIEIEAGLTEEQVTKIREQCNKTLRLLERDLQE